MRIEDETDARAFAIEMAARLSRATTHQGVYETRTATAEELVKDATMIEKYILGK